MDDLGGTVTQRERDFGSKMLEANPGAHIIPVLNGMNLIAPNERTAIRDRMVKQLESLCGARVAWLSREVGRPFFEIDAMAALNWTMTHSGEKMRDFLVLAEWLMNLGSKVARASLLRGRINRIESCIRQLKESIEHEHDRLHKECDHAMKVITDHRREAESQLRLFEAKSDALVTQCLVHAEVEFNGKLSTLLYSEIRGKKAKDLELNVSGWGKAARRRALEQIRLYCDSAFGALCEQFQIEKRAVRAIDTGGLGRFSVFWKTPSPGTLDRLSNFFGGSTTSAYMSKIENIVRTEWNKRNIEDREALRIELNKCVSVAKKVAEMDIKQRMPKQINGWNWDVTGDMVQVAARTAWLERGAPSCEESLFSKVLNWIRRNLFNVPPIPAQPRPGRSDTRQAVQFLNERIASGQPIHGEFLAHMVVKAAVHRLETSCRSWADAVENEGEHDGNS